MSQTIINISEKNNAGLGHDLKSVSPGNLILNSQKFPTLVAEAGSASMYAYAEFFEGEIRNPNTRLVYKNHVDGFLQWCLQKRGRTLPHILPGDVSAFLDSRPWSKPSKHQCRAALNHFFDFQVKRHAIVLNPAQSVRNERFERKQGKTPQIMSEQIRTLFDTLNTETLVGKRDRAVLACWAYLGVRVSAIASLRLQDLLYEERQWTLQVEEKRGKIHILPVRHDLEVYFFDWMGAAKIADEPGEHHLFRSFDGCKEVLKPYHPANPEEGQKARGAPSARDLSRMLKRRLKDAGLPTNLSPHSFRVAVANNLRQQGVPIEDIQNLLNHADVRTTKLYFREEDRVSRNLVERISY